MAYKFQAGRRAIAGLLALATVGALAAPEVKAAPTAARPAEFKALEFKLADVATEGEAAGTFEGYANVFGVVDAYSDVVVKGAFKRTLNAWATKSKPIPLLYGHDPMQIIGWLEEAVEDDTGLKVKGRLLLEKDDAGAYLVPEAAKVYALMRAKLLDSMSIGFDTIQKETKKGLRYLKEVKLYEVSVVLWPANEESTMSQVKNAAGPAGVKVADFATILHNAINAQAVRDLRWKIEDAFYTSLWQTLNDQTLDDAAKSAAIATNLDQFKVAMLDWTTKWLDLAAAGVKGAGPEELKEALGLDRKAGRTHSAATLAKITEAHEAVQTAQNTLSALLGAVETPEDPADDGDSEGEKHGAGPSAQRSTSPALGHEALELKNRITQSAGLARIQAEIKSRA